MLNVALAFAVLDLTGSAADVGYMVAAARGPMAALMLVGGVLGDRLSRRALMLGADVVCTAAYAVSAALLIAGDARLWQLLAAQAVAGAAAAFFYPASRGLLPAVVSAARLQQANALWSLATSAGIVVGPAVAGALVAVSGPGSVLGIDAATFGVSALTLLRLRVPPAVVAARRSVVADLGEGWRVLRSRTWLSSYVLASSLANLLTPTIGVLGAVVARNELGGAASFGLIMTGMGIGSVAGGLGLLRATPSRPLLAAALALTLVGAPQLALALVLPLPVVIGAAVCSGVAMAVANTLSQTVTQRRVDPAALARVSSYTLAASLILNPVGYAVVGPLALAIGTSATLALAAGGLAALGLALASLPSIRAIAD